MTPLVCCLRYLRDLCLVFSGAMSLLLFYLWYSQNVVQDSSDSLVGPKLKGKSNMDIGRQPRYMMMMTMISGYFTSIADVCGWFGTPQDWYPRLIWYLGGWNWIASKLPHGPYNTTLTLYSYLVDCSPHQVSATNIPIHASGNIGLISNFDRLKVQSMKTIATLAQNRRRMAQRSGQLLSMIELWINDSYVFS